MKNYMRIVLAILVAHVIPLAYANETDKKKALKPMATKIVRHHTVCPRAADGTFSLEELSNDINSMLHTVGEIPPFNVLYDVNKCKALRASDRRILNECFHAVNNAFKVYNSGESDDYEKVQQAYNSWRGSVDRLCHEIEATRQSLGFDSFRNYFFAGIAAPYVALTAVCLYSWLLAKN